MSIYLKIPIGTEINNIKELLGVLYSNNIYNDINDYYSITTYYDKECTLIECSKLRRSFEDLLEICRTYFPSTTEEDLMKELLDSTYLKWSKCGDINKIVFYGLGFYKIDIEFFERYEKIYRLYSKNTYTLTDLIKIAKRAEKIKEK